MLENRFIDKPEDNKVFSSAEICSVCEITNQNFHCIRRKLCIQPLYMFKRELFWDYKTFKRVYAYCEQMRKIREKEIKTLKQNEAIKKASIPTLEQLKKEHPLVTDERCFNLNYWPETKLKCFEDLDK